MNISKILIFFLAFFISTNLAYAVNYTVDDDSDGPANAANCEAEPPDVEDGGCRLRDAIAAADDGDTIDFILNGATITLTEGEIVITKSITINGPGADKLTIDADNSSRIFDIDDEATGEKIVEIKGLRLINGHADNDKELETEPDICPGGAIFNAEDLTIDSCEFEDNVAEGGNGCSYGNGKGGAIFNAPSPPPDMPMSLTVTNTKFTNNHADGEGGAIYNYETVIDEISFCTFLNNSANHAGGAIYNGYGSIITKIQNSVFNGNNSPWGGAIANYNSDIVDIHMSNFTGNYSYGGGGAIYNSTGADDDDDAEIMLIDNSNFNFNKALFSGGAILNYKDGEGPYKGVIWKIDNTDFNNNSAGPQGLPLLLKTSSKEYIGDDDDDGGAISNINAIIHEILNSKFDGNEANTEFEGIPVKTFGGQGAGGAIYNYGYDSELLVDLSLIGSILYSTFSNNSAHEGGAIFNGIGGGPSVEAKILTINKSTFNNNSADHGTGIFNESKIPVINNSTFNSNGTDENGIEECGVEDINCLENLCTLCEGIEDCILCAFFECGCSFDECGVEDFICLDNNCDLCDGEECVECAFFECGCLLEEPPLPPRSIARESNEGSPPGAYEGFFNSHANISFSTFSENLVGINLYGDDDDDDAELNIINSIVANSSILNCVINGYLMDFGGNHEDFLGFNGQTCFEQPPSLITLGPLADNGGPTQTVELIAGDPIDGANGSLDDDDDCVGFQASMAEDYYAPVTVLTDQRGANRPDGSECDSGAYETGLLHSVTITKLTIPPGGTDFVYNTSGFDGLMGCEFNEVDSSFTLDDQESKSCVVPGGSYEIDESVPNGQIVNIICSEKTDNTVINNANGELSFTFSDAGTPQSVNCLFINSFPNLLVKVSVEPIGATCPNGGVQIDTGEDDNQNNMLDPGEVDNTFHICNGVDGQDGQDGQDGDDDDSGPNSLFNILNEPPGSNCQAGGVRVQTGIDDNMNGILEPSEVDDTAFICNGLTGISGPPGEDGDSDSDDDGCELFSVVGNERVVKTRAATVFVIYSLIPGFIVLRRYRRRRNRDN